MMTLSMFDVAITPALRSLSNLHILIDKAAAFCETRKIEPQVVLNYRLAADMFPFTRQIQIVTDQAKGMASRLAFTDIPKYADTESSFDELKARVTKTSAYLKSFKPETIDGCEDKTIHLKIGPVEMNMTGRDYVLGFVFPNIYFHATTAYDILRHAGVELGKRDFMGWTDR